MHWHPLFTFTNNPAAPPAPAVTTTAAGAGGIRKRRQELWSVTVDGKPHVFDSLDALIAFLDAREERETARAEVKAERDAKRIIATGKARRADPPKIEIRSPVPEIAEYVADLQAKIDRVYHRAMAETLAREAEEEEDIKFIASLDL